MAKLRRARGSFGGRGRAGYDDALREAVVELGLIGVVVFAVATGTVAIIVVVAVLVVLGLGVWVQRRRRAGGVIASRRKRP